MIKLDVIVINKDNNIRRKIELDSLNINLVVTINNNRT